MKKVLKRYKHKTAKPTEVKMFESIFENKFYKSYYIDEWRD